MVFPVAAHKVMTCSAIESGWHKGCFKSSIRQRPSLEAVLNSVIPNYIGGYIYGALVESYCSEHNARMVAMQAANDSAQAMIHALSVEYNRVRQAAITQEITEVIAGAKAQKRKKQKKLEKRKQETFQKEFEIC